MELELAYHIILPILFFIALIASTIDAIAGGGGLISLPALIAIGVPPHVALGTNKLQAIVGTSVATYSFYHHGFIKFNELVRGMIFGLIGAALGAIISQMISNEILKKIIPILLLIILIYTILSPKLGHLDTHPKMSEKWFYPVFGMLLGFYDGFFGPAVGSFWIFALVYFLGMNLIKASANAKVLNLATSTIAAVCFAVGGNIDYLIAGTMALGQIIGGRLGVHLAVRVGNSIIRPLFIGVVSLTIMAIIYQNY